MAPKSAKKAPMSDEHKAALAQGRAEGKAVRDYLEGLRSSKPKRGRKRTPDTIRKRLEQIEVDLLDANPLDELKLVQERHDLTKELESTGTTVDLGALEARFVEVARSYSQRQGISYASWREVGVEAAVLKRAGISRSS
jgi:hypothetical protein